MSIYINNFLKKYINKENIIRFIFISIIFATISFLVFSKKTITVVIDGERSTFTTYKGTVQEALQNHNIYIDSKDKISPSLNSKLNHKSNIYIKRAISVQVTLDGKILKLKSAEENVSTMLKTEGITLNDLDKINPSKETKLSKNLAIDIVRVNKKTFTDNSTIAFDTLTKKDDNLANTVTNTLQEGVNGEKAVTTEITYENGKEISRKEVNETILKKPVDKIVCVGTLPVLPISRGGDPITYRNVLNVRATAYSAIHGIGNTYTYSGRKAVHDPNGYSTIAVDPSVIPLGSKVFVEGYGFAYAADTGTAIIGNTIDVFFDTLQEANNWAVKYVKVYILK